MMPRPPDPITSRRNPWFRRLKDAIDRHGDEIVIEGPKQIRDAIRAGWSPIALARSPEGTEEAWPGRSGRPPGDFSPDVVITLSKALFRELSDTVHSQGFIGLFGRASVSIDEAFADPSTVVVALDSVQDPGNVGTIVRLAASFGVGGVVLLPGTADALAPKAIRASAGTILALPVVRAAIDDLLAAADSHGFAIAFASAHSGGSLDPPAGGAVIVLGSEGRGVSDPIVSRGVALSIPMSGRVESLNVAAAAAILLSKSWERRSTGASPATAESRDGR